MFSSDWIPRYPLTFKGLQNRAVRRGIARRSRKCRECAGFWHKQAQEEGTAILSVRLSFCQLSAILSVGGSGGVSLVSLVLVLVLVVSSEISRPFRLFPVVHS